MHPVRLTVLVRPPHGCEPGAKARELVLREGDIGVVQVVTDQTQVQVPALRPAVGALGPRGDECRKRATQSATAPAVGCDADDYASGAALVLPGV